MVGPSSIRGFAPLVLSIPTTSPTSLMATDWLPPGTASFTRHPYIPRGVADISPRRWSTPGTVTTTMATVATVATTAMYALATGLWHTYRFSTTSTLLFLLARGT